MVIALQFCNRKYLYRNLHKLSVVSIAISITITISTKGKEKFDNLSIEIIFDFADVHILPLTGTPFPHIHS
jgi:hypothetical protein